MILRTVMAGVCSLMLMGTAEADADLDITGQLLPPFCTVHDGSNNAIVVDFGDALNINRIDGSRYRKVVSYVVDCEDDGQVWQLRLRLEGTAGWNNQTLQSDKDYLGLQFQFGGNPVELGRNLTVPSRTNPPVLTVVPVKEPSADPGEGVFTASANLLAEYY